MGDRVNKCLAQLPYSQKVLGSTPGLELELALPLTQSWSNNGWMDITVTVGNTIVLKLKTLMTQG